MYNTTEECINNWKQNIIKKHYCQVMFTIFKVLHLIGQENILTLKSIQNNCSFLQNFIVALLSAS